MIKVDHLMKLYEMGGEILHAIDDVSFEVSDGEFTAVIGPSGSGKSTLMNIIGCLDTPDDGSYYLDGVDVSALRGNALADIRSQKIGFIFQQFNLLQKLTALENVELPLIYQNVSLSERTRRAKEALDKVGLGNRMKHRPKELSGGQQQRVAIARALATNPKLMLADEPTGNLDSRSSGDIMNLLHELHSVGNTILIITHDSHIAQEAGRTLQLMDGKIVGDSAAAQEVFA
jgi:putative ABC transport system ATP-binding protein